MAREVLVRLDERRLGGDADRGLGHQLLGWDAGERVDHLLVHALRGRRRHQEHADQREPQTAGLPVEREQDAEGDQQVSEHPAQAGGGVRSRCHVTRAPPDQGPGHASPVEWKGRNEVETEDQDIDLHLVVDQRAQRRRRRAWQRDRERAEQRRDHGRHRRPREREVELVLGGLRLAAHARHAAEQPQIDLLDLHAASARDAARAPNSCARMLANSSRALASPSAYEPAVVIP